jgi:hypothetical protein
MPAPATKFTNVVITGTLTVGGAQVIGGQVTDDISVADGKQIKLDGGTATAAGAAATLSKQSGTITTETLTTVAGAVYLLTLTNTLIAPTSVVSVSLTNGSNTQGTPDLGLVTPGTGSCTIQVRNAHATLAFNGTLKISFLVINPV